MKTASWKFRLVSAAIGVAVTVASASAATRMVAATGSLRFDPSDLTINVGDTVVFSGGANFHTVTGRTNDPNPDPFCGMHRFTTCSRTFNTLGTFHYYCIPHEIAGMTGVIRVVSGVTSPLTVVTRGRGTVTPDLDGLELLVGNSYTITAVPAPGFAFVNWTGGVTSSTARLTFTMSSNLVLEANFVDVLRPTVAITSPPANARFTNGTLTLSGSARDNSDVTVEYRVETATFTNDYQMVSGTTNWSVGLSALTPGAYRFRARARDTAGNLSTEATRSVQILAPLMVTTSGDGMIGGGFAGTTFRQVGLRLSIPAVPKPGSLFSNWTGNVESTTNPLVFVIRTNTTLQANFVINPFLPLKGSFDGLFFLPEAQGGVRHETSGFVTFTVTDRGKYSGRLQLAGKRHPFSGQFSLDGNGTNRVKRPGTNELFMVLMLDLSGGSERVTGQVCSAPALWCAELVGDHAHVYAGTNSSPFQGKYTLIVGTATDLGTSFGSVLINAKGKLTFHGTLADGTPVTQNTTVSKAGFWPLYVALYGGKGSTLSGVTVATNPPPAASLAGFVSWIKPAMPTARYNPAGFTNRLALEGSLYQPPGTNKVLEIDMGMIRFDGGGLSGTFTNMVVLGNNNKVTNLTPNQPLVLTLTLPTGLFNGSATLTNQGVRQKLTFKGALLQRQDLGAGFFLGTNQSGAVLLEAAP
jgi:plastocyanin